MTTTPPATSQLYLVDLDRTLFDTKTFGRDLLTGLVTHFHINPHIFKQQIPQYTLPHEVGYDFFTHATALTGRSIADITAAVTPHFSRADYAYPDVADWIKRNAASTVTIITVGTATYQGLKFQFTPALDGLAKHIVADNKGKLLRQLLDGHPVPGLDLGLAQYQRITVIDDNPATFEHLGHRQRIDGIYISRPGEKYAGQTVPAHIRTITSFQELS